MLLQKIKLNNIRSYIDETITFPDRSVLLAGDIGCGKSSILLAIEFALFGIARGVLSGGSLLRVGADQGSVELYFKSDDNEYVIKRTLKKVKQDVRQKSGYILINGQKQELTPIELKSKILEILGYPPNLLTKSKSLIFRYTVYTPQEEMKRILMEFSEYRLDTLRKLFQIDKYKQIRENTHIIITTLKQKLNILKGQIQDLGEKKEQFQEKKKQAISTKENLSPISSQLNFISKELDEKKKQVQLLEQSIKKASEIRQKVDVLNVKLHEKISRRTENNNKIQSIQDYLAKALDQISNISADKLIDFDELSKQQTLIQDTINTSIRKETELHQLIKREKEKITEAEESFVNITKLDKCPTCKQDVPENHIQHILENKALLTKKSTEQIQVLTNEFDTVKKKHVELKKSREEVLSSTKNARKNNEHFKEKQNLQKIYSEKVKEQEKIKQNQSDLKTQIGTINSEKLNLNEQLKEFEKSESELEKAKQALENQFGKEKQLSLEKTKIETELNSIINELQNLANELDKKKAAKETQENIKQKLHWIQELFVNLMVEMEQHVMLRVYNEFNEIFQQFFQILIGDQIIVRLDEEFNPIIQQEGYDIEYEDLSGGEKTSLALAYRLALNKVINDLIQNIKTKELIILDEPTDGFSSHQLDKIRDVLDLLGCKQTIIVSHETKIESFVDNIIRIEKHSGVSTVSYV